MHDPSPATARNLVLVTTEQFRSLFLFLAGAAVITSPFAALEQALTLAALPPPFGTFSVVALHAGLVAAILADTLSPAPPRRRWDHAAIFLLTHAVALYSTPRGPIAFLLTWLIIQAMSVPLVVAGCWALRSKHPPSQASRLPMHDSVLNTATRRPPPTAARLPD